MRAEGMAAARLIRGELQVATASLVSALRTDHFVTLEALALDAWQHHAPALTWTLSSDDFDLVSAACVKTTAAARNSKVVGDTQRSSFFTTGAKLSKNAGSDEATRDLLDLCDRAIVALGPWAYPGEELTPWPPMDRMPTVECSA